MTNNLPDYCEIIIVDNACIDNSIQKIELDYPTIKVIKSKLNLGYAGGCNLGAEHSNGDLLLILERTIATLVEISLSNFEGGISAVIPLSESGKIKSPFKESVERISFILSKYCSKIFI